MAASPQAIWDLKPVRPGGAAVAARRPNSRSSVKKVALIGVQVLFALGAYSYIAWCVLR
jgi:hypothetical protein